MKISRDDVFADGRKSKIRDAVKTAPEPGSLVNYLDGKALVMSAPRYENFIGALVEIWVDSRRIKVPLGLISVIKENEE